MTRQGGMAEAWLLPRLRHPFVGLFVCTCGAHAVAFILTKWCPSPNDFGREENAKLERQSLLEADAVCMIEVLLHSL